MKKTFENPMLQIAGIRKSDIIATSLNVNNSIHNDVSGDAPGLRMLDDSWDTGY